MSAHRHAHPAVTPQRRPTPTPAHPSNEQRAAWAAAAVATYGGTPETQADDALELLADVGHLIDTLADRGLTTHTGLTAMDQALGDYQGERYAPAI